jgi:hypothetical protein
MHHHDQHVICDAALCSVLDAKATRYMKYLRPSARPFSHLSRTYHDELCFISSEDFIRVGITDNVSEDVQSRQPRQGMSFPSCVTLVMSSRRILA